MASEPSLKERVTILEERLKLFEAPSEHDLALAATTAQLRCARERNQRLQKFSLIFAFSMAAFWLVLDLFLVLR